MALIAPAERLRGGAFERARAAPATAVEWYGSSLDMVIATDATPDSLANAYREALREDCQLIDPDGRRSWHRPIGYCAGGSATGGGSVQQIRIPLEPGTACWTGSLANSTVLRLASCEPYGRPGALDLLPPRLFTGEPLSASMLRELSLGGLLLGPSRVAPYHTVE